MKTASKANPESSRSIPPPAPRPSAPVAMWAVVGAVGSAVVLWAWAQWIRSDDFRASPRGADDIPGAELAFVRAVEVVSVVVAVLFVWRLLVRPLLRERRLTFDGSLIIAAVTLWFYDPMVNYLNFTFSYNRYFLNYASWTRWIPGWESPNQHLAPEPVAFIGGGYVWWVCAAAFIGCGVLRKVRDRYPQLSVLGLVGVLFPVIVLLEFATEVFFIRGGAWAFPGAIGSLTLWAGGRYQVPLYEPVLVGVWCSGIAAFRYFRDDRGFSIAERGIERLRIPERGRAVTRVLAVTGAMHFWYLFSYFIPYNFLAVKADTFPAMPSYMREGICGTGTDYACPGEYVPVPSKTSLHIAPDDPRLPPAVRER